MTPDLEFLARRAVAAGVLVPKMTEESLRHLAAPTPFLCGSTGGVGGVLYHRRPDGGIFIVGLPYVVVEISGAPCLLPLLSDPAWLGWVLNEAELHGWDCEFRSAAGVYHVTMFKSYNIDYGGIHMSRASALVAILETLAKWRAA